MMFCGALIVVEDECTYRKHENTYIKLENTRIFADVPDAAACKLLCERAATTWQCKSIEYLHGRSEEGTRRECHLSDKILSTVSTELIVTGGDAEGVDYYERICKMKGREILSKDLQ